MTTIVKLVPYSDQIAALKGVIDGIGANVDQEYTAAEKAKLAGIAAGAQVNTVASVAGKTGAVTLEKADVGLSNVDNTSDANKPVSTAVAAALAGKATSAQGALADTALQPGASIDQIAESDTSKKMTAAERSKLAGIASGAQVNTVTSVAGKTGAVALDKSDVGLGDVDNTSDADKPVSTATQDALDQKADATATATALAGKADAAATTAALATKAAADDLTAETERATGAEAALGERVEPLEALVPRYDGRPGNARVLFSSTLTGAPLGRPAITIGTEVTMTEGVALQIGGADIGESGKAIVAPRLAMPIDDGRTYRVAFRLARAADPEDPEGHAINLKWQNLNAALNGLGGTPPTLETIDPAVVDGLLSYSFLIGKAGAPGDLDYVIPPTAAHGLPFVEIFGADQATKVLSIDPPLDVTEAVAEEERALAAEATILAAADDKQISVPLLDETTLIVGTSANGGVLIRDDRERPIGWSLPVGDNADNTQVEPRAVIAPSLRGLPGILRMTGAAEGGYEPTLAHQARAVLEDGSIVNVDTTPVSGEQVGTICTAELSCIVPENAVLLGLRTSAVGGPDGTGTETFRLVSLELIIPAGAGRRSGERTAQASLDTALLLSKLDRQIGPVWQHLYASGEVLEGAEDMFDALGRPMGWRIPIGSDGSGSYARGGLRVPPSIRSALHGIWIEDIHDCEISEDYDRNILPVFEVITTAGATVQLPTIKTGEWTQGNVRSVRFRAKMPDTDLAWLRPFVQQNGSGDAVAEETLLVTDVRLYVAESANLSIGQLADAWNGEQLMRHVVDDATIGRRDNYRIAVQVFAGAEKRFDSWGREIGFTIPAGSSGVGSLAQIFIDLTREDRAHMASAARQERVFVEVIARTSEGYAKGTNVIANIGLLDGTGRTATMESWSERIGTDRRRYVLEFDLEEGDATPRPYLQNSSSSIDSENDLYWEIEDINVRIAGDDATHADTERWALSQARQLAVQEAVQLIDPNYDYPIVARIEKDGSGDYLSIEDADAAILDGSSTSPVLYLLGEGTWDVTPDYRIKPHRHVLGKGDERTILRLFQPDDTPLADIEKNSTIRADDTVKLQALRLQIRNGRYCFHSDDKTLEGVLQQFVDVVCEHFGNEGAIAWQEANGGNPAGVWPSTHALGHGSSSGARIVARRSKFIGYRAGLATHTNGNFAKPYLCDIEDCSLIGRNPLPFSYATIVQPHGSNQPDEMRLVGNTMQGDIRYWPNLWMPTTIDRQPADRSEVRIVGSNNTPAVFLYDSPTRALRFDTVSTVDSTTIAISGDAAELLMGANIASRSAAGGAAAWAVGEVNVADIGVGSSSNVYITGLNRRLGNRSLESISLTVTVGGVDHDVVFDQDFTTFTVDDVLDFMNDALSGVAVASLYDVGGRYRPHFTDEERSLRNSSTTLILMGMVLAHDPDHRAVRAMTANDPASLFAGVAWEDIYPDEHGRVKTGGYLPISDVLRSDSRAFGLGDSFSIDPDNAGYVLLGGAQGLLTAIRSDAVAVRASASAYDGDTVDGDAATAFDPVSGRVGYWVDGHGHFHADFRNLDNEELTPLPQFEETTASLRQELDTVDGDAMLITSPDMQVPLSIDGEGVWRGAIADDDGNPYLTKDTVATAGPAYAPWRLRQCAARFRSNKRGVPTPMVIAGIGNSWMGTSLYWIRDFAEELQTEFGDGGPGWVGFAFSGSGSITGSVLSSVTVAKSGTWTPHYLDGDSPDAGQVVSTEAGAKYTITGPASLNSARLYASSGTLRYRWDGGTWTEIAISGDALQTFALSGMPSTAWTLEIEVVSGTVKMSGLDLQKTNGVRFHKLAKNGSNTAHWTAIDETAFVDGLTVLAPHLVIIMHAINDQLLSSQVPVPPAQYADNMRELIRRARLASPATDILLVTPPKVRDQGPPTADYAAVERAVAVEQKCAHLDLQYAFGEDYPDYAYGSDRPLLDDTLIHPTQTFGRAVIVDAIRRMIFSAQ